MTLNADSTGTQLEGPSRAEDRDVRPGYYVDQLRPQGIPVASEAVARILTIQPAFRVTRDDAICLSTCEKVIVTSSG